jgi:hypothetical protein
LLDGVLEFCLQQACARRTAGHAATVDVLGRDEAMVREPGDCEHETANRQQCKSAAEVQAASQVVGAQRCHQLDARTRDHDGGRDQHSDRHPTEHAELFLRQRHDSSVAAACLEHGAGQSSRPTTGARRTPTRIRTTIVAETCVSCSPRGHPWPVWGYP